jgi:hypothetical protein
VAYSNLTWKSASLDAADATSYTFSAKDIGTAASDRWVIVAAQIGSGNAATVSTIGGIAATSIVNGSGLSLGNNLDGAIAIANVPTGTTADIVVTGGSSPGGCFMGYWTVNMTSGTAQDTGAAGDTTGSAASIGASIDIPTNGFCVALCGNQLISAVTHSIDSSFTEMAEPTEDGGARNVAFAQREVTSSFSGTVTSTWAGGTSTLYILLASFEGGSPPGHPAAKRMGGVRHSHDFRGNQGRGSVKVWRQALSGLLLPARGLVRA